MLLTLCALVSALTATGPRAFTQSGGKLMQTELALRDAWVARNLDSGSETPFSFVLGDRASNDFLPLWRFANATSFRGRKSQTVLTWADPQTALQIRLVAVVYKDFPTVEWTLYFKNAGTYDSPIISNIKALDVAFRASSPVLHHFTGAVAGPNDYQPFETPLDSSKTLTLATAGGRPTNTNLPYFNLETGDGGVLAVLSWAGQWSAEFTRNKDQVRIQAGQELTHFVLHPGEEVRGPMAVLQFYKGDWIDAQNVWRRWMFAHNVPKAAKPMVNLCMGNSYPGIITNAAQELVYLQRYVEEGMKPDFWWEDAGWYKCGDPPSWENTGTWEVEPKRWPKGIREVSDWCHARDIRSIVWFEPERVMGGYWLAQNKPEWVLGGKNGGLLNLGDPDCRQWITDRVDSVLKEQGIDLYREDFNIDPLPYWRANDAGDRQGITEIRHVEGYFAFWDELLKRHPGMLIDSCASGGRRNDLETLRRAVPLLRSDYTFEPVGEQGHTYGISLWMPFNGTGFLTVDPYLFWSLTGPSITTGVDISDKSKDWSPVKKLLAQRKALVPCMYGDYYPLTPYSLANDTWMAWQFNLPEKGRGFFQGFRRENCPTETVTVKLRGLEPEASYKVVQLDGGVPRTLLGSDLMAGFVVKSPTKRSALVYTYERISE